jgi:protease IV
MKSRNASSCFILIVFLLVLLGCIALSCAGVFWFIATLPTSQGHFSTIEIESGDFNNQIAVIDIAAEIIGGVSTDFLGNQLPDMVADINDQLDQAAEDPRVKGVVLRFNTPGGTVYDSFNIADKVNKFQQDSKKPVVALIETIAASGGYLIASQTDYIVGNQTSIVGSIGVIVEIQDTDELLAKLGIKSTRITSDGAERKSGENYDDPRSPEYRDMKKLLNDYQSLFNKYVAEGRKLTANEISRIADGSIVGGIAAKENKLIDAFGALDEAVAKTADLAGISNPQVITYEKSISGFALPGIVSRFIPALVKLNSQQSKLWFSSSLY